MNSKVSKDFSGLPSFKIVLHGPSGIGKTTVLRLLTSIKKVEDPPKLASALSSISSPSGSTIFFDKVSFLAGDFGLEKEKGVKIHVWATAGGKKHHKQRKITLEGVEGIVLMLSPVPSELEDNRCSIEEISSFANELPLQIMINKSDLVSKDVLEHSLSEIDEMVNSYDLNSIKPPIITSASVAAKELISLLQSPEIKQCLTDEGKIKRECRPKSIDQLASPIRIVTEEIIKKISP